MVRQLHHSLADEVVYDQSDVLYSAHFFDSVLAENVTGQIDVPSYVLEEDE